mgnify:CR=1 FL=1
MIFDKTLLVSAAQVVTVTANSTDTIDLGATGAPYGTLPSGSPVGAIARDIGPGRDIDVWCAITAAMTAGGTSLVVTLEVDDNTGFSSAVEVYRSPTYLAAQLVAGFRLLPDRIPIRTNERYLRAKYTCVGTFSGGGHITCGIVAAAQTNA